MNHASQSGKVKLSITYFDVEQPGINVGNSEFTTSGVIYCIKLATSEVTKHAAAAAI
jgi:hypothetical protein